ncbi:MAG: VapC toxin family PIN domain ribonuclease [Lysobacterales bacterium CG02_land_8_20_14_3_00_62_12]|nr:MAG: VapC toxin family PIN domain ribonuclease [Xanthomonadales bacterium CG02_land_8_20_14_3_00_62_12]
MIALDTNLLVYAHQYDSPWRDQAVAAIRPIVEGREAWALPWPCVHEFFGVVTHNRFKVPSTPSEALGMIAALLASPSVQVIGESPGHFELLASLILKAGISGAMVHDARIAAICLSHGVRELWTMDRDFSRFPRLKVHNPLIAR